ncbi:MAG: hypothetical protein HQ501_08570 [Rhodospirillales bacterium]|nr:hypothetical protein [Rhodospirillales bacterium]
MAMKKNPLKLNKLQLRTLALAQVIAEDPALTHHDEGSGDVTLLSLPHAHGDHVHIGAFSVNVRDISGFSNLAVWAVLERKGLARHTTGETVTLTVEGLAYDTGLGHHFRKPSNH